MEPINERINLIIEKTGISKTEFAGKINVSQAFISQLCSGSKNPSERTLLDICREFNVDEQWLRTGEGEIFIPLSRKDSIMQLAEDLMKSEKNSFKERFLIALSKLNESEWEVLEKIADELAKEKD